MAVADDRPLPAGFFKDKIVFVGLNLKSRIGPSQRESFGTPFDQATYGTEIHATATSNLLSGDWIDRLARGQEFAVGFFVATTLMLIILLSSGVTLLSWLVGSLVVMFGSQYLLFSLGLAIPVVVAAGFGIVCGLLFRILLSTPLYGRRG